MKDTKPTADGDYMLDRGYRESARLHVQHWVWGQNFGWQLHPSIPRAENLRVIDVGSGTCCWLIEVARLFPPSANFLAVDISDKQFPSKYFLPSNIQLDTFDVLDGIPEQYIGAFDVVHLRALSTLVKHNDPGRLADNLMKLLRPGGYVQWDELDCGSFASHSPHASISDKNTARIIARWHEMCTKTDIYWDWLHEIPNFLKERGATILRWEKAPALPELYKAYTDEFTLAFLDMGSIATSKSPDLLGTADEYQAMFEAMLQETAQGVCISMNMMMALARKPSPPQQRAVFEMTSGHRIEGIHMTV